MKLRAYRKEDAAIICSWISDVEALYRWSADRIGKYPLHAADLNANYQPFLACERFIPLTAVDEAGCIIGHLFIRYPSENDTGTVRFGFVIVDPAIRGQGQGKTMLKLAAVYAREILHASRITLGVFLNNASARYCYEAVGFRATGQVVKYQMPVGEWECIEMVLSLKGNDASGMPTDA